MNINLQDEVAKCIEILKEGGIIIYPTDTIWGIGCDATNETAVEKIYKIKQSKDKKSMLVLVRDIANVARYTGKVPEIAWELMEMNDKPLTMILPNATGIAKNIIPEEGSIGVRVPSHEFCEQLLKKFNRPIVSTSVNLTGGQPAIKFEDISKEIKELVDHVVNKKFEGKPTFEPSSIILINECSEIKIIRK